MNKSFLNFLVLSLLSGIQELARKKKEIIWSGVNEGKINVIIGARSSLFLPFKKLGMIIVDEEHDQSYKQDEGIIYNARDMAIVRASFENIPINLIQQSHQSKLMKISKRANIQYQAKSTISRCSITKL